LVFTRANLFKRSQRMAEAWRSLAEEQDWPDGEASPGTAER
jgi:hypothetical protein